MIVLGGVDLTIFVRGSYGRIPAEAEPPRRSTHEFQCERECPGTDCS
jgi:hypothetical protein